MQGLTSGPHIYGELPQHGQVNQKIQKKNTKNTPLSKVSKSG